MKKVDTHLSLGNSGKMTQSERTRGQQQEDVNIEEKEEREVMQTVS